MGGQTPPQSLPKAFQKLSQTVFKTRVERGLQAQVPRYSPLPLRRGDLQVPFCVQESMPSPSSMRYLVELGEGKTYALP